MWILRLSTVVDVVTDIVCDVLIRDNSIDVFKTLENRQCLQKENKTREAAILLNWVVRICIRKHVIVFRNRSETSNECTFSSATDLYEIPALIS